MIHLLEKEAKKASSTELYRSQIYRLKQALRTTTETGVLHFQLGQLYFETADLTQAEYHFRHALIAVEQHPEAHAGLAALYKQWGKHQLATYHFEKACALEPGWRTDILIHFFESPQAKRNGR